MKYIMRFSKEGYLKYISHLDMIRLFNRCFKRADISLVHSQGFNPHPKLTFAQPLSLGYTSSCEIMQIETEKSYEPSELKDLINENLPDGIKILSCMDEPDIAKNISGKITNATYEISFLSDIGQSIVLDNYSNKIDAFFAQEHIYAEKKQKRKKELKQIDIKPMIRKVDYIVDDNLFMTIKVDCGSNSNLNPELILKAFFNFLNLEYMPQYLEIRRVSLD